eukprot:g12064.t1
MRCIRHLLKNNNIHLRKKKGGKYIDGLIHCKNYSTSNASEGFVTTMNGYGVSLNSIDMFEEKFINEAEQLPRDSSILEIGSAFGKVTIEALQRGSCNVCANDIDKRHLDIVEQEWKERCSNNIYGDEEWQRLQILHGDICQILMSNSNNALKLALPFPLRSILIANVLHFLSPSEIIFILTKFAEISKINSIHGTETNLYISLDSPWHQAYKLFWPVYNFKKHILKRTCPGFQKVRYPFKAFVPERLNAVKKYHVMEPDTLTILLNESGWNVVESKLFSGDEKNNPIGVSLGNNIEMVGAHAKIVH